MLKLPSNLAGVSRLAATDAARYALTCIRVAEKEDGYEVQATDGKRLVIITGPGREEQTLAMLADAPNGASVALIPAKDWGKTLKAAKKQGAYLVLGEQASTFAAGDNVSRLDNAVDVRWPNFDLVLPKDKPKVEFAVDGRLFAELLAVAAAFCPESSNGRLTFRFWKSDRPFVIETRNDAGQNLFALMMPIS
jgi:DNA polymerase III sliding clamp (beta) subunit (PCNA family)